MSASGRQHITPDPKDMALIIELRERIHAANNLEAIRRCCRVMHILLDFQAEDGAQIVLCKKGQADRAILFV